ncbi:ATPase [Campylobacter jejuni]|nr:ATPase [Campylobacter jejuni]EHN6916080.1 ATPase [Campylobacter jejuni]
MKSEYLLLRNLSIYGLGGMIAPFIGIKIIDILTAWILRILRV